jgi:hypothetical protein
MLHVYEGTDAASILRLRTNVLTEGGFTRRFGTVDFNHAAAGDAANAQSDVELQGAGLN